MGSARQGAAGRKQMNDAFDTSRSVNCVKCRHYMITWQPAQPYGCKAHGFMSRRNPALVVFESSGMQCQLFEPKTDRGS
jgi:hypothetical protein